MNKKRILTLALVIGLLLQIAQASEENFNNLNNDQKTEWILENVEPIVEKGIILEKDKRDSGIIYTRLHEKSVYNSTFDFKVGTVKTQLWWRCNYNKNVTDFGVSRHEAVPVSSYRGWTEYVGGYWVLPDNVRVSLVAYFADMINVYDLNQVFNLLGNGTYDYRDF